MNNSEEEQLNLRARQREERERHRTIEAAYDSWEAHCDRLYTNRKREKWHKTNSWGKYEVSRHLKVFTQGWQDAEVHHQGIEDTEAWLRGGAVNHSLLQSVEFEKRSKEKGSYVGEDWKSLKVAYVAGHIQYKYHWERMMEQEDIIRDYENKSSLDTPEGITNIKA